MHLKPQWRRLFFPIVVSTLGVAATSTYERWSEPPPQVSTRIESVGFVQSSIGFHLRQKENAQMWEPLQDGDPVFPSDKIKTGSQGELTLSLPSAGKTLDLESDTALLVEASEKVISLKPSEGYFSLLPSQDPTPATRSVVVLGEEDTQLNVPALAASFLKEASGPVQQIDLSGEALAHYQNIQWKEPVSQAEVELNPDSPTAHRFAWTGQNPDWKIRLEWGPSRRQLPEKKIVDSALGLIELTLPIGKHFWRWSVIDTKSDKALWSSPTSRLLVRGLFPPSIVGPSGGLALRADAPDIPVTLRWLEDKRFSEYKVELSMDPAFAPKSIANSSTKANELTVKPAKFGNYYWRLTGIEANGGRSVVTKPHNFKVLPKAVEKIQMQWLTQDSSQQSFIGANPTLSLKWTAKPAGERTYRIKIKPVDGELGRNLQHTVKSTEAQVPLERAGTYQVFIEALNSESDLVGATTPIQISVQPQPLLKPPTVALNSLQASSTGEIHLQWSLVEGAQEYQIEVRAPDGKVYNQSARRNELQLKKLLPGSYNYSISSVDRFGRSSARSPAGRFTVPEKSGLKAPKIRKVEVE